MTKIIALLFATFVFQVSALAQQTPIPVSHDISAIRLTPEIYLYRAIAEIESYGAVSSNGLIVVSGDQAALLDTPVSEAQTKTLVMWIENTLNAHVRIFVPNHWHSDCMGGLGYLKSIGVDSYANTRTIEAAKKADKPLPDTGFANSLSLDLNGTKIECRYLGSGHSEDNIVVWLPESKILFGGCMIKYTTATDMGNMSDAVPAEWQTTLDRIMRDFPDARIVVPGHGKEGGIELVRHTKALLEKSVE